MIIPIPFGYRGRCSAETTWVGPGHQWELENWVSGHKPVRDDNGISAVPTGIKFYLQWSDLTPKERKAIRSQFGGNAGQQFNNFTRVTFERNVPRQQVFSFMCEEII